MIRYALLLSAALLIAVCFACAPQFVPQPEVIALNASGPGQKTVKCTSADAFANSVMLGLDPNFRPEATGLHYPKHPSGAQLDPNVYASMKADLIAAFNLASSTFFRSQLCDLKGIFIKQPTCGNMNCYFESWGFRENQGNQSADQGKYVALSQSFWQGGNPAPPYHDYETMIMTNLIGVPGPQYTFANPDTSAMTILATLAHEVGHILWWEKGVAGFSCNNAPDGTSQFYTYSWQNQPNTQQFHLFGAPVSTDTSKSTANLTTLSTDIQNGHLDTAANDLTSIYGGEWASLFGTVSADEDFVETYKLLVLTTAQPGLTSLQIAPPYQPPFEFMTTYTDSTTKIYAKTQWVRKCILGL
jgi:hypothetical protein